MLLENPADIAIAVGQAHCQRLMHPLAEQEYVNLAVIIELAGQRQNALRKGLHQPFAVQRAHRAGNVKAQADLGAVAGQADFFQRNARLLDEVDELRRFARHALFQRHLGGRRGRFFRCGGGGNSGKGF